MKFPSPPVGNYLGLIAAGLLLPVIFSLSALFRGTRISVQDALTDYGITAESKPHKKKAWFSLPLSNQMVLAFRNTLRRKKRLLVTVATMSLGVAIFATGFNVRQSLSHFLTTNRVSMKYDVQVVLREATPAETALDPFRSVTNVDRIELWNGGKGRLQSNIVSTMNSVGIVALPYNTDLMSWDVIKGRWLQAGKETEIVMNQRAAESFGYPEVNKVHPIRIKDRFIRAKLVGIVKEFDVAKIYIDKTRYDRLVNPAHLVNSLMFVAGKNSYDQVIDLKKAIETAIAGSNLDVLFVMSQAERAKIIYDHLNIILTILSFLALLVLVVSALGMASATGINIMERTREIGVLRAIGATPKMIYRIFIAEGMMVSVVSIVAGIILSWPLSVLAATYFGYLILRARTSLEFSFSSTGFLITLALTMIFGWLASRIPARRAVSVSTRKALSYE